MQQQEINELVQHFFTQTGCTISKTEDDFFSVDLTIEMDKKLTNRPFYWHYVEKTGGEPKTMTLKMSTSSSSMENKQIEFLHFGSPRLHQIFSIIKEHGHFIRLYEDSLPINNQSTALYPWFHVNMKVHYQCDRKKETMYSIGLNLITGQIIENFTTFLETKKVTSKIPDRCYTLSGIITVPSGFNRIKTYITQQIEEEEFEWAYEAIDKMNYDLSLLEAFYEDFEEPPESYETELHAIKEQYTPKITVEIINGGMFYLLA